MFISILWLLFSEFIVLIVTDLQLLLYLCSNYLSNPKLMCCIISHLCNLRSIKSLELELLVQVNEMVNKTISNDVDGNWQHWLEQHNQLFDLIYTGLDKWPEPQINPLLIDLNLDILGWLEAKKNSDIKFIHCQL